jgi:hypothetical protein
MGTLEAYFDDSGEETAPRELSVAVAGAVAPSDIWHDFALAWTSVLDEYNVPRSAFHTTDLMSFQGEVFKPWQERGAGHRDRFVDRLVDVMRDYHFQPIGVNLPLQIYEARTKHQRDVLYGKAYYACLHALFQILAQLGAPSDDPVNIILAEKKKHIGKAHKAFQTVRDIHPSGARLVGFDPSRSPRDVIQLQAADLVAWEMTRFFKEPFRPTLQRFEQEMCGVLHYLTRKDVASWFDEEDDNPN